MNKMDDLQTKIYNAAQEELGELLQELYDDMYGKEDLRELALELCQMLISANKLMSKQVTTINELTDTNKMLLKSDDVSLLL